MKRLLAFLLLIGTLAFSGSAYARQDDLFQARPAENVKLASLAIGLGVVPSVTNPGGQVVTAITLNFHPDGNFYLTGSSSVGGTLYFSGGCTNGTQIGSLVATVSGGGSYAGSWTLTGANAGSFTVVGSNPGLLECSGTVAAGSYSFNATAGSNNFSTSITAYAGTEYFIATTGNDSTGNGTSGNPWKTPNHAHNCGDMFSAATGTYSAMTQNTNMTCSGNDNVAMVKCATFDGCKWSSSQGLLVNSSYIGFIGWECDASSGATCFNSQPPTNSTTIHHIVFADDVCNGSGSTGQLSCLQANEYNGGTGPTAVDDKIWLANITYNGDPGNSFCGSNISDASPANDTTGPHVSYVALNVSYHSNGGVGCNGAGTTSDDNGIIEDSPNINTYTGNSIYEGNLVIGNGGTGIHEFVNPCCNAGAGTHLFLARNNTLYGQFQNSGFDSTAWGINCVGQSGSSSYLQCILENNIDEETSANTLHGGAGSCNSSASVNCIYPMGEQYVVSASSTIDGNWFDGQATYGSVINWHTGYSCLSGPNVGNPASSNNTSCNNNVVATDAVFTSATIPGAPSCGSATDTLNCIATTIGNFKPTKTNATSVGGTTGLNAVNYGAVPSSGVLTVAACDAYNSLDFIKNVERWLPSDMDPCG